MTVKSFRSQVVEKLVSIELGVAELYQIYADKFPQQREFWSHTVKEERQHARWLERLDYFAAENPDECQAVLDRLPLKLVNKTLDTIRQFIDRANDPNLTLKQALESALLIEQSIIEKKFFEAFQSTHGEMKRIFESIGSETWEHADRIRLLLSQIK